LDGKAARSEEGIKHQHPGSRELPGIKLQNGQAWLVFGV
jgi:hypothetical protein